MEIAEALLKIDALIKMNEELICKLNLAYEEIALLKYKLYGASSEKLSKKKKDSLLDENIFNEAEVNAESKVTEMSDTELEKEVSSSLRKRGGRKPLPKELERENIVCDISENEKICPHDHCDLVFIGEETIEQLDYIPAKFKVIKTICYKYACSHCQNHFVTGRKQPQPIEKSIATAGLLAHIAVSKYCDALPLYRQEQILNRMDVQISRTNLANWMIHCGDLVEILVTKIKNTLLQQEVLHGDETTVQVLKEEGKKPTSLSYVWVLCSGKDSKTPAVYYEYHPSRSHKVANEIFSNFKGFLQVDGYDGYNEVCKNEKITRLGCWAHSRRKFDEADKAGSKKGLGLSAQFLELIGKLYKIEGKINSSCQEEKLQYRQSNAVVILEEIKAKADTEFKNVPPKSKLGEALNYLLNQWPHLTVYVTDGNLAIDNNRIENLIRPFALGRKNWLFCDTPQGANASARLYTLIMTAKLNHLNPFKYLKYIFTELPKILAGKDKNAIDKLLPWNCVLME